MFQWNNIYLIAVCFLRGCDRVVIDRWLSAQVSWSLRVLRAHVCFAHHLHETFRTHIYYILSARSCFGSHTDTGERARARAIATIHQTHTHTHYHSERPWCVLWFLFYDRLKLPSHSSIICHEWKIVILRFWPGNSDREIHRKSIQFDSNRLLFFSLFSMQCYRSRYRVYLARLLIVAIGPLNDSVSVRRSFGIKWAVTQSNKKNSHSYEFNFGNVMLEVWLFSVSTT